MRNRGTNVMLVQPERKTVAFDVDSTLVFATGEFPENPTSGRIVRIGGRNWMVHEPHVEAVKDFAARGHTILLWSQGGAAWAAKVARALEIEGLVWACLSKPDWIFDDKPVSAWLEETRRYYKQP
jgi:phosphoserine phosphatase